MAASNQYMQSAVNTIYELSSDETIREQCRAREEFEAYQRYLNKQINDLKKQNAEQNALLTAKDAEIADLLARNAELTAQLGKKNV